MSGADRAFDAGSESLPGRPTQRPEGNFEGEESYVKGTMQTVGLSGKEFRHKPGQGVEGVSEALGELG